MIRLAHVQLLAALTVVGGCTVNDPNVGFGETAAAPAAGFDGTYLGATRPVGDPDPRCAVGGEITLTVRDGMLRVGHRHARHGMTGPVTADGRFTLRDAGGQRTMTGTITGSTLIASESGSTGRMQQRAGFSCAYAITATRQ